MNSTFKLCCVYIYMGCTRTSVVGFEVDRLEIKDQEPFASVDTKSKHYCWTPRAFTHPVSTSSNHVQVWQFGHLLSVCLNHHVNNLFLSLINLGSQL